MAARIACPNTRTWLREALRTYLPSPIRLASTTSAINRGLRAEQNASQPRGPRRPSRPQYSITGDRRGMKPPSPHHQGKYSKITPAKYQDRDVQGRIQTGISVGGLGDPKRTSRPDYGTIDDRRGGKPPWKDAIGSSFRSSSGKRQNRGFEAGSRTKSPFNRTQPPRQASRPQHGPVSNRSRDFQSPKQMPETLVRSAKYQSKDVNDGPQRKALATTSPTRSEDQSWLDPAEQHHVGHSEPKSMHLSILRPKANKKDSPLAASFDGVRRRLRHLQSAERITPEPDLKEIQMLVSTIRRALQVIQNRGVDQMREYLRSDRKYSDLEGENLLLGTPSDPGLLWSQSPSKPEIVSRSMLSLQLSKDAISLELLTSPAAQTACSEGIPDDTAADDGPVKENVRSAPKNSDTTRIGEQKPSRTRSDDAWTEADKVAARLARKQDEDVPNLAIPRTTAASMFLYGNNTVFAALTARRRTLYKLYVHHRDGKNEAETPRLFNVAGQARIPVLRNVQRKLLDAMSENRPHNGVVLEASQLPAPPLLGLGRPNAKTGDIPLQLAYQSAEDAAVNGTPTLLPYWNKGWRHPFVLMLDGVLDPQNVGNIIRTAYFYGVNAIAVSTNTCCSLASAALAKASSGACEAIQIFTLPQPSNFVYASKKAGWKIYAAVAPSAAPMPKSKLRATRLSHADVSIASPLADGPVILILGAEGEGLRANLIQRADVLVSVARCPRAPTTQGPGRDVHVDSINVGTAAAVLLDSFWRNPLTRRLAGLRETNTECKEPGSGNSGPEKDEEEATSANVTHEEATPEQSTPEDFTPEEIMSKEGEVEMTVPGEVITPGVDGASTLSEANEGASQK